MNLAQIEKKFDDLEKKFETLYEDTIDVIPISNSRLKDALSNQIDLQLQWGTLSKSTSHLHDVCEIEVEGAYSEAMTSELKDSYKTTTVTEAREYAKANKDYQNARKLLAKIKHLRDNSKEVYEVINSRKYVLNNITNAVVASMENHII